jgi:hypothetical protein
MCGFNFALSPVEFSFIPVINPTGMQQGTRLNVFGQDPNRGYVHSHATRDVMSVEGHLIVNNLESIINTKPDCIISLHEDVDEDEFYLYSSEVNNKSLTAKILSAVAKIAKIKNGQVKEDSQTHSVVDGYVGNCCDGSIEDLLLHCGINRVVTTETPGLLSIENRIDINCEILSTVSCSPL